MSKSCGDKIKKPGTALLSHPVSRAVSSALAGLTSEFGMGSGVSPPLWAPGFLFTGSLFLISLLLSRNESFNSRIGEPVSEVDRRPRLSAD